MAKNADTFAPPQSWSYGWEKLHLAVTGLALHEGSLADALRDAWIYNLSLVRDENLPQDARQDFDWVTKTVQQHLTRQDVSPSDPARLDVDELIAHEMAKKIIGLYDLLAGVAGPNAPLARQAAGIAPAR